MSVLLPVAAKPPRLDPDDVRLLDDPVLDREVSVLVGGRVSFVFRRRDGGDWEEIGAWTTARGFPIDEAWLAGARELARKVFRAAIGDGTDLARCPECGRVLCSALLANTARSLRAVRCLPPVHVALLLDLEDGRGGALGYHELVRFDEAGRSLALSGRWVLAGGALLQESLGPEEGENSVAPGPPAV